MDLFKCITLHASKVLKKSLNTFNSLFDFVYIHAPNGGIF